MIEYGKINHIPLIDAADEAILIQDLKTGIIIDVNKKMYEMFGYNEEEVRQLKVEALSSGEEPFTEEEASRLIKAAEEGSPQLVEWLVKDKNGKCRWVEMNIKRAMIEGADRLLVLVRDIGCRKKAEQELKRRADFNKLITGISTRFINLSINEIDEWATCALRSIGEFASVDRSYIFRLYDNGRKMDNTHEWCAEGIEPHIHRLKGLLVDDFALLMEDLKAGKVFYTARVSDLPPEAATEKKEWQLEGIQSLICVPMVLRGELVGFVGFDSVRREKKWDEDEITLLKVVGEIFSNALDRKRSEEALRESEARYRLLSERLGETVEQKVSELQQAQSLAAIGQMVSVVAHEVRNPLQTIRMGMDILNLEMEKNEKRTEVLAGIDHGVNLLNHIITELLEFSKPVELHYSSQPIAALVEEALKILSHKMKNIAVHFELDRQGREVSVDASKFIAVLVNLLSNAIEAMPNGGDIWIRTNLSEKNERRFLRLSITDNGCGISERDLARIQEPFVTTKSRGTGLGLSICRKIMDAHKGAMHISSKLNQGTTIELMIPL